MEADRGDDLAFAASQIKCIGKRTLRRRFLQFRRAICPRNKIEIAILEFFFQSRISNEVLAYLSVQEGEDFDGSKSYDTEAPRLIRELLRRVGKVSHADLSIGLKWFRVRVSFDPLINLRRAYLQFIRSRGQDTFGQRLGIKWQLRLFRVKIRVVRLTLRWLLPSSGDISKLVKAVLGNPTLKRLVGIMVYTVFEDARKFDDRQWAQLLALIEDYFVDRIPRLLQALPHDSVANHGLIKLVKVAFGTAIGRTSARQLHEGDPVEFVFNTIRLAYSWGITYPLVDNILDSKQTTVEERKQLVRSLEQVFSGNELDRDFSSAICFEGTKEVLLRMQEAISLIPAERREHALGLLRQLLDVHKRDSERRLSSLTNCDANITQAQVLDDTAAKAALVRLATMEICGITVDSETQQRCWERGLFNQLGDDLWDIYEDAKDDRVTPFTLYLSNREGENPFELYLLHATRIAKPLSGVRQRAAFMGCCETLRDAYLTLQQSSGDPLNVLPEIDMLLKKLGITDVLGLLNGIPHVDFDAVLFYFEDAIFELLGGYHIVASNDTAERRQ